MPSATSQQQESTQRVDIAIVGGGPAGLALAAICERRGISYTVYEHSAEDTPPRGGCLDLHVPSGQRAMREAGVWDAFMKYGRSGEATSHRIFDHKGNYVLSFGEGENQPELDRHEIKLALLSGISKGNVQWQKTLESATRDESGQIVLKFTDGSSASGFKLVVGADGVHSKVRGLVTPVNPGHSGMLFIGGYVLKTNPFWETLRERAKLGPYVIMGRKTMTWIQIQGTGHYRADFGVVRPANFARDGTFDINDTAAVKKLLLSDTFFGQHDQFCKDVLNAVDGPFRDWPLSEMPVQALGWRPSADVTLIGDSAHATTPFIGEGANCAMLDAVILAEKLGQHGFGKAAIGAYESDMFERAKDVITRSAANGRLFYSEDAPYCIMEAMKEQD